jgi:hypothetical protein
VGSNIRNLGRVGHLAGLSLVTASQLVQCALESSTRRHRLEAAAWRNNTTALAFAFASGTVTA